MTGAPGSKTLSIVLLALGFVTACDGETTSPPPPPPIIEETPAPPTPVVEAQEPAAVPSAPSTVTAEAAEIDWDSARTDLATATGQPEGIVSVQSVEASADVPVLLPTGIVSIQSADGSDGVVYRKTADGYFAFYPGAAYNIIVNGTNQLIVAESLDNLSPQKGPVFSTDIAGAQVWLSKYGASYTIEFECNDVAMETDTCISEEEALKIAEELVIVESR